MSTTNPGTNTGSGITTAQYQAILNRLSALESDINQIKEVLDKFISNY